MRKKLFNKVITVHFWIGVNIIGLPTSWRHEGTRFKISGNLFNHEK